MTGALIGIVGGAFCMGIALGAWITACERKPRRRRKRRSIAAVTKEGLA